MAWSSTPGTAFGIFSAGFEYDYGSFEWTYDETLAGYFGSFDVHKESRSRVSATLGADVTERIKVGLAVERLGYSYDTELRGRRRGGRPASSRTRAASSSSLRRRSASGRTGALLAGRPAGCPTRTSSGSRGETPQDIEFDDDSFMAPYVALAYSPRENIEVRVGYGVSPTNYVDTPVEGRGNGRERWLSQYLWEHSDHDIL